MRSGRILIVVSMVAVLGSVFSAVQAGATERPSAFGSGSTWDLSRLPGAATAQAISCASSNACDVIADSGTTGAIFVTNNGGASWTAGESAYATGLTAISCAPRTSDCWAVGNSTSGGAIVEYSSDGGVTWSTEQLSSTIVDVQGLSCATSSDCVVVGRLNPDLNEFVEGAAAYTTDGGRTWNVVDSDTFILSAVSCPSATVCTAVGDADSAAYIAASSDGGASWAAQVQTPFDLDSISCASTLNCVAVGAGVEVTSDGGNTWTSTWTAAGQSDEPEEVACSPDRNSCWMTALGSGTASAYVGLFFSLDGGVNWSSTYPPVSAGVPIACPTASTCFTGVTLPPGSTLTEGILTTRNALGSGTGCAGPPFNEPGSSMAADPGGAGYWLVTSTGTVAACGNVGFYGSIVSDGGVAHSPLVAIAATPAGDGYYQLERDGTVIGLGPGASPHGSGTADGAPYVGMAVDDATGGYWLVNANGGVFDLAYRPGLLHVR
jgi:hypothetical protein